MPSQLWFSTLGVYTLGFLTFGFPQTSSTLLGSTILCFRTLGSAPFSTPHLCVSAHWVPSVFIRKSQENHRKIMKALFGHLWVIFRVNLWKRYICLKAPQYYSASFWINNVWICLWERPKTLHVNAFGASGRVLDSQNPYYLSLETPAYSK